jgi:phage tail-like protein
MPDPKLQSSRPYSAAHFAFTLDGNQDVGLFRSIEGGGVKADVMTYQMGGNYDRWRQVGKQKYEDIKLQVGMSMSQPFYHWVEDFVAGKASRKNGSIIACDFTYSARAERTFSEAMIKELTFPKLDAQDKTPAYMNIALTFEDLVFKKGNGASLGAPGKMDNQKLWTSSNFHFELDGFADACHRVTKVDSFTIKQNIAEYQFGGRWSPMKWPTGMEYPQISFYLPEVDAQPFFDLYTKRVMDVKREQTVNDGKPKHTGQITTYDNGQNLLFTVEFFEAEIFAITPDKSDAGSEEIKQVKIDLFCERMKFKYH